MQLKPGMDLNANKSAKKSAFMAKIKPKSVSATPVANTAAQNEQQINEDGEKNAQIAFLTEEINNLK
jgi:hypothetical protein